MVPPFIPNDKMMYPLIPQIDPLALSVDAAVDVTVYFAISKIVP